MQIVLKRKKCVFGRISSYFEVFPSKSYVLYHLNLLICISKHDKNTYFFLVSAKNGICRTGGSPKVADMSATISFISFFTPSLRLKTLFNIRAKSSRCRSL